MRNVEQVLAMPEALNYYPKASQIDLPILNMHLPQHGISVSQRPFNGQRDVFGGDK